MIAEMEWVTSDNDIEAAIDDLCRILNSAGPLAVECDRGLIAGPQPSGQENIHAVDESSPRELACLLSVRGTQEGNWQPAELGDMLQHCLTAPASEYLRDFGQSAEFAADSPSECAVVDMTLGELFQCAHPPLGLLIAVKRTARRLMSPGASDMPAEVHRLIYFASIAAAMARLGERISGPARTCCGSLGSGLRRNRMPTTGCRGCLRPPLRGFPAKAVFRQAETAVYRQIHPQSQCCNFWGSTVGKLEWRRRIERGNFLLQLHDWRRRIVIELPRGKFGPPLVQSQFPQTVANPPQVPDMKLGVPFNLCIQARAVGREALRPSTCATATGKTPNSRPLSVIHRRIWPGLPPRANMVSSGEKATEIAFGKRGPASQLSVRHKRHSPSEILVVASQCSWGLNHTCTLAPRVESSATFP